MNKNVNKKNMGIDSSENTNLPFHRTIATMSNDLKILMQREGALKEVRESLHNKTLGIKKQTEDERNKLGYVDANAYMLSSLSDSLKEVVKNLGYEVEKNRIEVSLVDRKQFGADVTIKISRLIGQLKGEYNKTFLPALKKILENNGKFHDSIATIEIKGIYINIKLRDEALARSLSTVETLGSLYGHNNTYEGLSMIDEYSSPNTAKSLHAGHIRSTVLGHTLGNIYEANGYIVHRINHINDRGGFGVYLVGQEMRGAYFEEQGLVENDCMVAIYKTYRLAEKVMASKDAYDALNNEEMVMLSETIGGKTYELLCNNFQNFKVMAQQAFKELEKGSEDRVAPRKNIVEWSLLSFEKFYDSLGIHIPNVMGESFYAEKGKKCVLEGLDLGNVVYFDEEQVKLAIQELNAQKDSMEEKVYNKLVDEIKSDEGAYVVKLENFERYVILKKDGSSIYATRDIGTIDYRIKTFDPAMIVYLVGQEQADHFGKLFESAHALGYDDNASIDTVNMLHAPFGFYVDAITKKKLSSRAGAANVHSLIEKSKQRYRDKYKDSDLFSNEEIEDIANKLAIGGIVYNDISKSKMSPVLVHDDLEKTIEGFERSGGVYIVYQICRAKKLLQKYDDSGLNQTFSWDEISLNEEEAALIKKIMELPLAVKKSCKNHEVAPVAQYLFTLAQSFSSFYQNNPLLKGGDKAPFRAYLTRQLVQVLENGCQLCHIGVPNRI